MGDVDELAGLRSPSRMLLEAGTDFAAGWEQGRAQAEQVAPWMDYIESLTLCRLDLSAEEREARLAAYRATAWRVHDFEPPMHVTRVRSADGLYVAIRGDGECWYEGAGHSNWAYVLANGKARTPGPDSAVFEAIEDDSPWVCWLDLDFVNPRRADGTANDTRRPGEFGRPG